MKQTITDVMIDRRWVGRILVQVNHDGEWLEFDKKDLIGLKFNGEVFIKRIRKWFKIIHSKAKRCRHTRLLLCTESKVINEEYKLVSYKQCLDCKKKVKIMRL